MPVTQYRGPHVMRFVSNHVERNMRAAAAHGKKAVVAEMRASGSPSDEGETPGVDTGEMLSKVDVAVKQHSWGVQARVGILKDPVQAAALARLVGGFVGRDSAGRLYEQAPRPGVAHVMRDEARRLRVLLARRAT